MIAAKLAYVLLLIVLAVFSVAYSGTVPVILTLTLLIGSLATAVWSFLARRKIKVSLHVDEPNEEGRIRYRILVKNMSFFPVTFCQASLRCVNLFDGRSVKQRIYLTVPPMRKQEIAGILKTDTAGVYDLSCLKIFFTDWFRLFRRKIVPPSPVRFYVWPHCYSINVQLTNIPEEDHSSSRYSPNKVGTAPDDFFGVREYRDGDRLQHVHWKLTGKTGQFVVKEFSLPLKNAISIVLEFSEALEIEVKNAILDAAVSLSNFFLENRVEHELCFLKEGQLSRYEITGQAQLYDTLKELLSQPPETGAGQPALLAYQQPIANKHLICVAWSEGARNNPVLMEHPLPSVLLQVTRETEGKPVIMDNFRVVPVHVSEIQKSLTGVEI